MKRKDVFGGWSWAQKSTKIDHYPKIFLFPTCHGNIVIRTEVSWLITESLTMSLLIRNIAIENTVNRWRRKDFSAFRLLFYKYPQHWSAYTDWARGLNLLFSAIILCCSWWKCIDYPWLFLSSAWNISALRLRRRYNNVLHAQHHNHIPKCLLITESHRQNHIHNNWIKETIHLFKSMPISHKHTPHT